MEEYISHANTRRSVRGSLNGVADYTAKLEWESIEAHLFLNDAAHYHRVTL